MTGSTCSSNSKLRMRIALMSHTRFARHVAFVQEVSIGLLVSSVMSVTLNTQTSALVMMLLMRRFAGSFLEEPAFACA